LRVAVVFHLLLPSLPFSSEKQEKQHSRAFSTAPPLFFSLPFSTPMSSTKTICQANNIYTFQRLVDACSKNDPKKFIPLLEAAVAQGVDINQRNVHGDTLLHIACYGDLDKIVRELLQGRGKDLGYNAINDSGYLGLNALHVAFWYHSRNAFKELLADSRRKCRARFTAVTARDGGGATLLHHAIFGWHTVDSVKLLLCSTRPEDKKALIRAVTIDGETVLHWACNANNISILEENVDEEDMRYLVNAANINGETPLHHAHWVWDEHRVAKMMDVGRRYGEPGWANKRDNSGFTPLHSTIKHQKDLSFVRALLRGTALQSTDADDGKEQRRGRCSSINDPDNNNKSCDVEERVAMYVSLIDIYSLCHGCFQ
jgi:ankyrin repeat protein